MAYFVLMCYGHSISSPSLTLPIKEITILIVSLSEKVTQSRPNETA